jgi:2-dehydro-3-deoxy-L-rhamnonate dehydrogenase (NAD+)
LSDATVEGPELSGQVAIVTGAGRGIGAAIATLLASRGAAVAVCDVVGNRAEEHAASISAAGGRARAFGLDVADEAAMFATVAVVEADLGAPTVLVNNAAAVGPPMAITKYPTEEFRRVLEVNLFGAFHAIKAVVPGMQTRGYGRIVNISSIAVREGLIGIPGYTASKAALLGLTRSVATELAESGILVNAVIPGSIDTRLASEAVASVSEETDEILQLRTKNRVRTPMARAGSTLEVAEMVAWMASPRCSFTTGSVFDVSGGRGTI